MTNRRFRLTLGAWMSDRPGGLRGLIATACLASAALLGLWQTLVRHADSFKCPYLVGAGLRSHAGDGARSSPEDLWRAEVSGKLDEILARIPEASPASGPVSD